MSLPKIKIKFMLKKYLQKKYKIFNNSSLCEKFIFKRNCLKELHPVHLTDQVYFAKINQSLTYFCKNKCISDLFLQK